MSDDWKTGFKKALIDVLVHNGQLLRPSESDRTYSWADYSKEGQARQKHVRTHDIDYERTTWEESEWHEFMGTFYEADTRVKGIDLRVVMKTGEEYDWRWQGSVAELIHLVVNEAGK